MKKYIKEKGKDLEVNFYYNKGGMNHFNGKVEKRGFYLSVCPVKIEERENGIRIVSYTAFTGIKMLVWETKRFSSSAEKKAMDVALDVEQSLVEYIMNNN